MACHAAPGLSRSSGACKMEKRVATGLNYGVASFLSSSMSKCNPNLGILLKTLPPFEGEHLEGVLKSQPAPISPKGKGLDSLPHGYLKIFGSSISTV